MDIDDEEAEIAASMFKSFVDKNGSSSTAAKVSSNTTTAYIKPSQVEQQQPRQQQQIFSNPPLSNPAADNTATLKSALAKSSNRRSVGAPKFESPIARVSRPSAAAHESPCALSFLPSPTIVTAAAAADVFALLPSPTVRIPAGGHRRGAEDDDDEDDDEDDADFTEHMPSNFMAGVVSAASPTVNTRVARKVRGIARIRKS